MNARDVVAGLRAAAEVLDSARRYGIPMPFHAGVTDYAEPRLQVHTAEEWQEWVGYLEATSVDLHADEESDQLWLRGADGECVVTVVVIVGAGEGAKYLPESEVAS